MLEGVDGFLETFLLFKFLNISWPSSVYISTFFYLVLFKRTSRTLPKNQIYIYIYINHFYMYYS